MKKIKTEKKPIFSWVTNLEDGALEQAKNLANLPFTHDHVALMPDCHQGFGMPIGGVLATIENIIPNAVGVDIGCGMHAVRTNMKVEDLPKEKLVKLMKHIRDNIPVGFNHREERHEDKMPKSKINPNEMPIVDKEFDSACKQIGTLGGGNHFIEIQKDEKNFLWFMIHSGSRNLGYRVADYYNKEAIKLNEIKYKDLAFLPEGDDLARCYLKEMNYCLEFARANRNFMAEIVKEGFSTIIDFPKELIFLKEYDIHHNYVIKEKHFEKNVWVHRKGATSAEEGEIGIIPGSQGTSSFIVKGKGNRLSFNSCSHGAGRKMGRNVAKRTLDFDSEVKKLNDQNILHTLRSQGDLDEAPGSYKDINEVMNNQSDLIEIVTELKPLGVVKG